MAKVNLGKKPEVEVSIYLDITDKENPVVIPPEIDALIKPDNLPENTLKLTSKWERPTLLLNNIIDLNSYTDKVVAGQIQRVYDSTMKSLAQMRVLLKGWNLDKEVDPAFTLKFEKSLDNPKINILTYDTMEMISNIEPVDIINAMFLKALRALYTKESAVAKKVLTEVVKDSTSQQENK
jgi:hypothetical protein